MVVIVGRTIRTRLTIFLSCAVATRPMLPSDNTVEAEGDTGGEVSVGLAERRVQMIIKAFRESIRILDWDLYLKSVI